MTSRRALIEQVTARSVSALCPEVALRLAEEPLAPWLATESLEGCQWGPPFWAHAWPGGVALARFVLDGEVAVEGRRVLDFAAGCGVAGIAAARRGATVVATEVDAFALEAIWLNAALNGVVVETSGEDVIGQDDGWHVVLVGDVFYQAALSARVWAWLTTLVARGAEVLVGDPGRSFLPQAELACVATYQVPPTPAWDSVVDRPARVWRLR